MRPGRRYLRFHTLDRFSGYLSKDFVAEQFRFSEHTLAGTPQMQPRWKRAVAATNFALGDAVGRLYVERYFAASAKARAEQMAQALIAAFDKRIEHLTWMAPETKRMARAKLASLRVDVGYPAHWRDYSSLEVVRGDAVGNLQRAEDFEYRRNLAKLGHKIDRDEWVMNPQLVSAVNLPAMNVIQFPAAILQPPLFSPDNTAAMNFGATGATIGHEISHSFDDQGALFDASGRLQNWWTAQDFEHFAASGEALVQQYDGYRPFPDMAVRGKQTLSENIADLAGLVASFDAYRLCLRGEAAPLVDGLTGDQQFFLSFAQSWRSKRREPALRRQIITDEHAPDEYRVDTVRNIDAWYEAFAVKPGQALTWRPTIVFESGRPSPMRRDRPCERPLAGRHKATPATVVFMACVLLCGCGPDAPTPLPVVQAGRPQRRNRRRSKRRKSMPRSGQYRSPSKSKSTARLNRPNARRSKLRCSGAIAAGP